MDRAIVDAYSLAGHYIYYLREYMLILYRTDVTDCVVWDDMSSCVASTYQG
jgi:hypothetical protein